MSEYSLYDFTETIGRENIKPEDIKVVLAMHGRSSEGYGQWKGGFVMKMKNGKYVYVSGWCDTSGWGCRDGTTVEYADQLTDLHLPVFYEYGTDLVEWDKEPADLNKWIKNPKEK